MHDWVSYVRQFYRLSADAQRREWEELTQAQRDTFRSTVEALSVEARPGNSELAAPARFDPIKAGVFGGNTPSDHIGRELRVCSECEKTTTHDLWRAILVVPVGVGLPFGRKSTVGKAGTTTSDAINRLPDVRPPRRLLPSPLTAHRSTAAPTVTAWS